ncbi:phosphoribosylformylglycinamidine synthase [Arcanobacterium pinnipediorum]|uniref:Phosphoribosylformylglycinamidine synthase n=1 Tax=Arcanobacterium pinnipediorum TaxID=1503041 RepID=A0ABY5AK39_9ACTO|nr:phosphoribosylformylglycinamidine synthase [Arcanobacterium pinnipediorum]USR80141.1 phosphoribosylformylglycinamidine synthase [Arcanobacterium pinnipediorum]
MISRIYVEAQADKNPAANSLVEHIHTFLNITSVRSVRIINRYDCENVSPQVFTQAITNVFAQPPLDHYFTELELDPNDSVFAVSYLPGQYDQRADSAAVCIQMMAQVEKPRVSYACLYVISGDITPAELAKIKAYLINPVDSHEVSLDMPQSLALNTTPAQRIPEVENFISFSHSQLQQYLVDSDAAMDLADLKMVQEYFAGLKRNPTETELKVIDTYWSDHCRHTTFNTALDDVTISDERVASTYESYLAIKADINPDKPVTLMNIATMAMKHLRAEGKLDQLDISDEINACTINIDVDVDGQTEQWLLLFKNETHNHPTEIEPFGGAATCIGGAIRDPLSGRAYVYAAMRVTGAGNPLQTMEETLPGKLPQRKIVKVAADGYSSYGNQIGLATSFIDEFYDPSYVAKRLEIGAVIGAVKKSDIQRSAPEPGDLIVLIGGATGRDGIGGATGSSRSHDVHSVSEYGAQVQKGNALEERKLQRLFRNSDVTRIIKKCNDFGAGGVSVAIGELADGLRIDLDRVYKKYDGLNATEIAISESQERMALVIAPEDLAVLSEHCYAENVAMAVVAEVTAEPMLTMSYMGQEVVRLERSFLDTNGAPKSMDVTVHPAKEVPQPRVTNWGDGVRELMGDLNHCSKEGLIQQFDSTIGAHTVLMPLGGKYQKTPIQAMAHKLPVLDGQTTTCSVMAYGFNPVVSKYDPYQGAYDAVIDSVAKVIAAGADPHQVHLSFQEYFPSLKKDREKWGLPLASLMGAFQAQLDVDMAAIGGKDSMSGTFESYEVIPTLVSFAVSVGSVDSLISPEFKTPGNKLYLVSPQKISRGYFADVAQDIRDGKIVSAYSLTGCSISEAAVKMSLGNRRGVDFAPDFDPLASFVPVRGGFLCETTTDLDNGVYLGQITDEFVLRHGDTTIDLAQIQQIYEAKLEPVYPVQSGIEDPTPRPVTGSGEVTRYTGKPVSRPRVLIPVFPGTNCEYETAAAWKKAGAEPEVMVINNLSVQDIEKSIDRFATELGSSHILFIPGGFSGGDEPDGSAKFITSFMRNAKVSAAISQLLDERGGLIGGICNGFQALIKLGLLPYGKIMEPAADMPTLTYNSIKRHQSSIVNVRVSNSISPWLRNVNPGDIFQVPISHGEGRIVGDVDARNIATQYVNLDGEPTNEIAFNPNNSLQAIEGLVSDDGRVFGKMGHAERYSDGCYLNVPGDYDMQIFASAVAYFTS